MKEFSSARIIDFMRDIQSMSDERCRMVTQIRDIYFACDPGLQEDIKYGGLVFFKKADLIGGVFCYKHHISIEFGNGVYLSDPHSVLEGKGKLRRHIKLHSPAEVASKNVAEYVQHSLRT